MNILEDQIFALFLAAEVVALEMEVVVLVETVLKEATLRKTFPTEVFPARAVVLKQVAVLGMKVCFDFEKLRTMVY